MGKRIERVARGEQVTLSVNGSPVRAFAGETIATALLANGIVAFQRTRLGRPRAPFCNMGVCYECLVLVEGSWVRACMTPVADAMRIATGICMAKRPLFPAGSDSRDV